MKKKKLYRIYVGGSYSDEVWATSQVSAVRAFRAKGGDYRNYSVKARAVKANASRRRNPPATKAGRRKASVERRVFGAPSKNFRKQKPGREDEIFFKRSPYTKYVNYTAGHQSSQ